MFFSFSSTTISGTMTSGYLLPNYTGSMNGSETVLIEQYGSLCKTSVSEFFRRGMMDGMAISIQMLPLAGPLDGNEYIPIVQGGVTKRIMVSDLLRGVEPPAPAKRVPRVRTSADDDEAIDNAIQAAREVA